MSVDPDLTRIAVARLPYNIRLNNGYCIDGRSDLQIRCRSALGALPSLDRLEQDEAAGDEDHHGAEQGGDAFGR